VRAGRDAAAAARAAARVRDAARGAGNMLPPLREALAAHCTVGELCTVLREEWGTHDRPRAG
jgi:methylmalonyl-CoA mutase N-terminal domain/subunit